MQLVSSLIMLTPRPRSKFSRVMDGGFPYKKEITKRDLKYTTSLNYTNTSSVQGRERVGGWNILKTLCAIISPE